MTADRVFVIARSLVSRGVSVIPVPRGQKRPHVQWGEFQHRVASTDEVDRWFSRGEHNLAIILGSVSGLVAVDSDSDEAEEWATHHLPPTPMMTRTSKGRHRFYRHPGVLVRNKVKIHAQGGQIALDVRGDGGYVIGPYSQHPSGHIYEPLGDWTTPLSELPVFDPAWLPQERGEQPPVAPVPAVMRGSAPWTPFARAQAWLSRRDPAVQGQGGDQWTYVTACNLVRDFALSDDEAFSLLLEWNQRCAPPWTEGDLRKKLASARRNGSNPDGSKLVEQRESHTVQRTAKPTQEEREEEYFRSLVSSLEHAGAPPVPPVPNRETVPTPTPAPVEAPKGMLASDLVEQHIAPMKWAVVDMLPEGMILFSGRPKMGKSWIALQLAIAIACGEHIWGYRTSQGSVLYLALEDGPRRMKSRISLLVPEQHRRAGLRNLHIYEKWPRWDLGGRESIEEWLRQHTDARLVIVDVWKKLAPPKKKSNSNEYDEEYSVLGPLQTMMTEHSVGMMLITHNRKPSKDGSDRDFLDEVIGSTAITGAADTVMGFTRARGSQEAKLEITSRDFEEIELELVRDDDRQPGWQRQGAEDKVLHNPLAKAIIELTMERGEWVGKTRDLLAELDSRFEGRKPLWWPLDARRLGMQLRHLYAILWDAGVDYQPRHERSGNSVSLVIRPSGPLESTIRSSRSSQGAPDPHESRAERREDLMGEVFTVLTRGEEVREDREDLDQDIGDESSHGNPHGYEPVKTVKTVKTTPLYEVEIA